jgi:RND family efflux transporter MFP subunit
MRKLLVILIIVACAGVAGFMVYGRSGANGTADASTQGGGPPGGGRMGAGGPRAPMPVEFTPVKRAPITEHVMVVGNLIGAATVQAVPKINGRLETVNVKLGDAVRRGQIIAKVEDREIQEQVRQAEAQFNVSRATIRQREADLKLAQTNLERNRSLLERELLPRQTFDDTEARYQAALAQVDLSRAQFEQAKSRLDELQINLANTVIASPVDGFVGKRFLDPGAFVGPNSPVASLVDIRTVRMVANLVEKDVKRVTPGTHADVEVDAFPGETFAGRVSRVAPVFDPATRTAEMEIEVPNPGFRLKPGMYARVQLTVATRADALTVPRNAIVLLDGRTGVFVAASGSGARGGREGTTGREAGPGRKPDTAAAANGAGEGVTMTAKFVPVETGIREGEQVEVVAGIEDGTRVITTGAGALKDGDRIVLAGGDRGRGQTRGVTPGQGGASR